MWMLVCGCLDVFAVSVMMNSSELLVLQYHPHQNSSVDEAMTGFRGRLGFRQYMPKKLTKYGVKVRMRADPENGYCNGFQVYTGRVVRDVQEKGLSMRVALDLCERLRGMHHVINKDNFFSSVELCERLRSMTIFTQGTVRINRKGLLRNHFSRTCLVEQGDYNMAQSGNFSAYSWKDKGVVNLLSTTDDPAIQTVVERK
eukprot:XP_011679363.1 PREDICTED: piggyBac transposable element-derived protein 4-like [Strongylocentrotus purpuratus]